MSSLAMFYQFSIIEPFECIFEITYSCTNTGPRTDMCDVDTGGSVGIFDTTTGVYEFYSEDKEEFPPGTYTFFIEGVTGDPEVISESTFTLELIDPCLNPTSLQGNTQPIREDYKYTGNNPSFIFEVIPFSITPDNCQSFITYSCSNIGPRSDMCDVSLLESASFYDETTGIYEFYTEDQNEFLPGTYNFTIKAQAGSLSAETTFSMKVVTNSPFFIEPRPHFINLALMTFDYPIM